MGAFDPDPSIRDLAPLELPAPADHARALVRPGVEASAIVGDLVLEARSDPQADGTRGRPGSLDREPHASGLCLGKADARSPLGRRKADEFDDPGPAGANEVDRDIDLPEGDIERIGSAGAAQPRPNIWHVSTVGGDSKRDRAGTARQPLNKGSTTMPPLYRRRQRRSAAQTASARASTNWLL